MNIHVNTYWRVKRDSFFLILLLTLFCNRVVAQPSYQSITINKEPICITLNTLYLKNMRSTSWNEPKPDFSKLDINKEVPEEIFLEGDYSVKYTNLHKPGYPNIDNIFSFVQLNIHNGPKTMNTLRTLLVKTITIDKAIEEAVASLKKRPTVILSHTLSNSLSPLFIYNDGYYTILEEYYTYPLYPWIENTNLKQITLKRIHLNGRVETICKLERNAYLANYRLLNAKYVRYFWSLLKHIAGKQYCYATNSAMSSRVFAFRPWVAKSNEKENERIQSHLSHWSDISPWHSHIFARFQNAIPPAILEIQEFLIKHHAYDKKTAQQTSIRIVNNIISSIIYSTEFPQHAGLSGEREIHLQADDPDWLESILRKGADVNSTNQFGKTPLMYALQFNNQKSVDILLRHKADLSITTKPSHYLNCGSDRAITRERKAIHYAAENASLALIERVINSGANEFSQDGNGNYIGLYLLSNRNFSTKAKQTWVKRHLQRLHKQRSYPRPSFNCLKANLLTELAICSSNTLAERDKELSAIYKQQLSNKENGAANKLPLKISPRRLRLEQSRWLKKRDSECFPINDDVSFTLSCLLNSMDKRISEL